jgi:CHAD domain-containing protein
VTRSKSEQPETAWVLARHLSRAVDRRVGRIFGVDPWAPGVDRVEAVHAMRVASRRLRAFVDLFRPQLPPKLAGRARRELRRIGRTLGPLRELDVHVQRLDATRLAAEDAVERAAVEVVLERIERRRRRAERRARRRLAEIDLEALRADLREVTDRAVGPLARHDVDVQQRVQALLQPRIEAAFRGMPQPRDDLGVEVLHEIRVRAKRLRYAVELVAPALGDAYGQLRKPLRRYHRVVGDLHDESLLQTLLAARHAKLVEHDRTTLAEGLSTVLDRSRQRSARLRAEVPDALGGLDRARFEAALQRALGLDAASA